MLSSIGRSMTATRPMAENIRVKDLYAFEIASSSEWSFGQFAPGFFQPNVFYDIAATLEKKMTPCNLRKRTARPFPHPHRPDALRAIARRWGSVVGVQAAEAFALIRSVRCATLSKEASRNRSRARGNLVTPARPPAPPLAGRIRNDVNIRLYNYEGYDRSGCHLK